MKSILINKSWILILIGVISFLALSIILIDVVSPQQEFVLADFLGSVAMSAPFAVLIAIVDYHLVRWFNRSKFFTGRMGLRIASEAIIVIIVALIFVVIGNALFIVNHGSLVDYLNSEQFYISATAAVLINIFTTTFIEFFFQLKRNENLQKENLQMQYQQLKSQINPHFLFNSLNVLTSLIHKDSQQAVLYTQRLSQIYRYVLSQDTKELIYLADEIEFIKTYIEVLRIRYGEALICEVEVSDEVLEELIPPMSLQLLIENAVKHNAVSTKNPLRIRIASGVKYLTVSNNIIPRIRVEDSTGIGLKNLELKYQIISQQSIEVDKSNNIFKVTLPLL